MHDHVFNQGAFHGHMCGELYVPMGYEPKLDYGDGELALA